MGKRRQRGKNITRQVVAWKFEVMRTTARQAAIEHAEQGEWLTWQCWTWRSGWTQERTRLWNRERRSEQVENRREERITFIGRGERHECKEEKVTGKRQGQRQEACGAELRPQQWKQSTSYKQWIKKEKVGLAWISEIQMRQLDQENNGIALSKNKSWNVAEKVAEVVGGWMTAECPLEM